VFHILVNVRATAPLGISPVGMLPGSGEFTKCDGTRPAPRLFDGAVVIALTPTNAPRYTPPAVTLDAPAPNPTNAGAHMAFSVPARGEVTVAVYDVRGAEVVRLLKREVDAGSNVVEWDGTDGKGTSLPSGIYFVRLVAGTEVRTRRLVLVR